MTEELKKITQKELNKILAMHKAWVETDGEVGQRADLSCHDLSGLVLYKAILSGQLHEGSKHKNNCIINL